MRQKIMVYAALLLSLAVNYNCSGDKEPGTVAAVPTAPKCLLDAENALLPDEFAKLRETAFISSPILANINQETQNQVTKEGPFLLDDLFGFIEGDITRVSTGMKVYFGAFTTTNCESSDEGCITTANSLVPIFVLTRKDDESYQKDFGSYYVFDPVSKKLHALQDVTAKAWVQNYRDILTKYGRLKTETHTLVFSGRSLQNMICNLRKQRETKPEIKTFNIHWGAYEKDVILWNGDTKAVKDKLTMMINVPDAGKRLLADLKYPDSSDKSFNIKKRPKNNEEYFDTAVPCPPGINCNAGDDIP